ncbi:hypothetical protein Q5752_003532 [Cryptotrichosporon argae]
MSALKTYKERPVVVLTNDDGPPSDHSPNIYAFAHGLAGLGWDVRVVVPSTQKSWVGKAYAISDVIELAYFYPLGPDGRTGEISPISRPLKDGETMEWILLNGTPATCANIALHNLYPGEVDLVVSGPNHGRNSSTAFALSSGTIGAALGASLAVPVPGPASDPSASLHTTHMPAIAVSFGVVKRPVPDRVNELAQAAAVDVVKRLFDDWGFEDAARTRPVPVYSVNIPLVERDLVEENRKVCWTRLWRNTYGRLFEPTSMQATSYDPSDHVREGANEPELKQTSGTAGPAAFETPAASGAASPARPPAPRRFKFAPDLGPALNPDPATLPVGTDAWAFAKGYISVTPVVAEYSTLGVGGSGFGSDPVGDAPLAGRLWE